MIKRSNLDFIKPVFFPNLEILRAFLAWAVVFSHLFDRLNIVHLEIGNYAVSGFFVLSGFLITYLLLTEFRNTGTISLIKFYYRRILRIWPLYYFYLLLAIIYVGEVDLSVLKYYVMMIPNIAYLYHNMIPYTNHYWSLGVEEQFYLFWPIFVLLSKDKFLIFSLMMIVFIYAVKMIFYNSLTISSFMHTSKFDLLILGSVLAYFWSKNIFKFFESIRISYLILIVSIIFYMLVSFNLFYFSKILNHFIFGLATCFLILSLINIKSNYSKNNFFILNGKISFGIYVYHSIILDLVIKLILDYSKNDIDFYNSIIIVLLSFIITFFTALISYYGIERPFNKLRTTFNYF